MRHGVSRTPLAAFAAASLAGCAAGSPIVHVAGACADVHGGTVCTWANTQGANVIDIGATIPMASITGAPHDHEMTWPPLSSGVLELPAGTQERTGLSHLTVYWEPHGHPPGAYLTPHFDFHFYTIGNAERLAIDCTSATKPAQLPEGYALPDFDFGPPIGMAVGICVPGMGMHALPESELESTDTFRGTMVVGYYHGETIFIEPMISRDMLLERKSFELPIPAGSGVRATHFRADYDAETDAYRFTFSGFPTS
jgi:hypothetical protein